MIRVILIEDESIILRELMSMLEDNKNVQVVGTYTDPLRALNELMETKPDCAFLDIEMPILNGIELAEKMASVDPKLEVIFVTAYNNYAAQAFEVNAIDYLLKPIRQERLDKAVNKMISKIKNGNILEASECTIRCFGAFEIIAGTQIVKWNRSKSKEFVAYMLQNHGRWVTKYKLCEEQWYDYEPDIAITYLQTAVYGARKSLKEAGCSQIQIEYFDNRYRLKLTNTYWDVQQFDEAYELFCRTGSRDAAIKAKGIYKDEYLEGETWLWADLYRENYIYKYENLCTLIK